MARSMKEVHTINYYSINEGAARRAKEMNSFSDYKEGSATAEYRAMVDKAAAIAEQQKSRVDPMYHEKIDHLLDTYARKLAENMNQGFAIDARVPSVMIAGPANFPVGKKEKQNRARDSNMEEWRYIQGLLDKIRSTGMGGISADDPAAIEKLQKKLDGLERSQLIMKEVNAYYRKHGKLDGCALLSPDQIEKLKASMASSWRSDPRPFESYQLTNNNAEIRRVKARIEQLSKQAQQEFSGWEFDGGRVEMNREDNRLQVFFDGKPYADTQAELKSSGFRWAPSVGAWQRQLTDNAIRAADRLECIKPLSGDSLALFNHRLCVGGSGLYLTGNRAIDDGCDLGQSLGIVLVLLCDKAGVGGNTSNHAHVVCLADLVHICSVNKEFHNDSPFQRSTLKPTWLFTTTSWLPPSTMEVEETTVSLAFCCSSGMESAPQLHMVLFTLYRVVWTPSARGPA